MENRQLIRCACLFVVLAGILPSASKTAEGSACTETITPQTEFTKVVACMNGLVDAIETLRKSVESLSQPVAPIPATPKGTVIAFNGKNGCPKGWRDFEAAHSRMIIGVGRGYKEIPNSDGGVDRVYFSERKHNDKGGEEDHTLSVAELPTHHHAYLETKINNIRVRDGKSGSRSTLYKAVPGDYRPTQSAGGEKAHNNMPPFIALYFCEKM